LNENYPRQNKLLNSTKILSPITSKNLTFDGATLYGGGLFAKNFYFEIVTGVIFFRSALALPNINSSEYYFFHSS
jgi:hypothetical protein